MNGITKGSALSSLVIAGLVRGFFRPSTSLPRTASPVADVWMPGTSLNKSGNDVTGHSVTEGRQGRSAR
jgi:hypothetical protein